LSATRDQSIPQTSEIQSIAAELKSANETLWALEDAIRECERKLSFDAHFIELSRSIYRTNDRRSALKRQINELLSSAIGEVKSYAAY